MGKLIVSEFVSLDGVFENPSWTMEFGFDPKMGEALGPLMGPTTSDILLGRATFEMFAPGWRDRSAADDPGAPFMNDSPKHVVTSGTELGADWQNSSVFGPYDAAAIAALKETAAGNIWSSGSGQLVRALLADGLLDELHLFVYPTVRGTGAKLFGDTSAKLTLAATEAYANGVVHLAYARS